MWNKRENVVNGIWWWWATFECVVVVAKFLHVCGVGGLYLHCVGVKRQVRGVPMPHRA